MKTVAFLNLAQKICGMIVAVTSSLLVADSGFLLFTSLPQGLLIYAQKAHIILGFTLCVFVPGFIASHWALHNSHVNKKARYRGKQLSGLLVASCAIGIVLYVVGKSSSVSYLVLLHELTFLCVLLFYLRHRWVADKTPILSVERYAALLSCGLLIGLLFYQNLRITPNQTLQAITEIGDFGLSNSRTESGHWLDEKDLADPSYCAECHTEIAKQWDASAHHFSSLNDPFYFATFNSLQESRPSKDAKFCGGCHDPLILHSGNMNQHVDLASSHAQSGITCLACHSIVALRDRTGNGSYILAPLQHYPYRYSQDPNEQALNRSLILSKPAQHKKTLARDFLSSSEFCLVCHKANLPATLINYVWKRGQNDYDAWFDSGVGQHSARSFQPLGDAKNCQDCHMPDVPSNDPAAKDGYARSHGFPGSNTTLAAINNNVSWQNRSQKMLEGALSIDIFSMNHDNQELLALPDQGTRVPVDQDIELGILVRNRRVGHFFPGGVADMREAWVELSVMDESGKLKLTSGLLDESGFLEASAHRYHAVLLDRNGKVLKIHDVENLYTVLYSNRIQLGTSDWIRFSLRLPSNLVNQKLTIQARLLHRKFSREYMKFVQGDSAFIQPIVNIAEDTIIITADLKKTPLIMESSGEHLATDSQVDRIHDSGIASFLQGDTAYARKAFARVSEQWQDDIRGPLHGAQAALADGDFIAVEQLLQEADKRKPGFPKTAWLLSRLRIGQGQVSAGISALNRALEIFPEDRILLRDRGAAYFNVQNYAAAKKDFERLLAIDNERADVHSYLMRIAQASGEIDAMEHHRHLWETYRPRSDEKSVSLIARQLDENLDREANRLHTHPLRKAEEGERRAEVLAKINEDKDEL